MRFAIWFGVAAFILSGSLFNAFAHDAQGVLGLAFITGVAAAIYGAHLQQQHESAIDNPGGRTYNLSKHCAFHRIKDILLAHRHDGAAWSFSVLDFANGRISATLTFVETMSAFGPTPNLTNQPRKLTLHATVSAPTEAGPSVVTLTWIVTSPMNRDTCDAIIHEVSSAINSSLTTSSPLTRTA